MRARNLATTRVREEDRQPGLELFADIDFLQESMLASRGGEQLASSVHLVRQMREVRSDQLEGRC